MRFLNIPSFKRFPFLKARKDHLPKHVAWIALHDGGVMVALIAEVRVDEIEIKVRFTGAPERNLSIERIVMVGDLRLAHAGLDSRAFEQDGPCIVTATVRGRSYSERYEVGNDLYSGRIDCVRDYSLEGWVAPLFANATPSVQLLVDGSSFESLPVDRYRREFRFGDHGQGGWNGFRLPLPAQALDGEAHHLAIRAGQTIIDFGLWCAKPQYNIDLATPRTLRGWYFDSSACDGPTSLRIVKDGMTQQEVKTHFRSDLKAAFGLDFASFVFSDLPISSGSTLVAGPEGTGIVVGVFGGDQWERIRDQRASARAHLLGSEQTGESLLQRLAIRTRLVDSERVETERQIAFQPLRAVDGGTGSHIRSEAGSRRPPPVCAIVPVYKGLSDLKRCLASLIPQLRAQQVRALVINDGSPDPEIGRYLSDVASRNHPGLMILENQENLGFIGTVNRGISLLEPDEDVLLVNADTILPPNAVARLARHCHARLGIASVTPMSNNATILSFPSVTSPNAPVLGLDVAQIDRAFIEHAAEPVEIPTGIGFCMHLNRLALDEVGPFSLEWGRGYCEEVDWCLAARDLGWIHLAATDTFVIHEGSVSFGVAERIAILETNHAKLERLYPEYLGEVHAFVRDDVLEDLRTDVLLRLFAGRFQRLTLHLMHGLGGGTERYIVDLQALPRGNDHEVAVLSPLQERGVDQRLSLTFHRAGAQLTLRPDNVERTLAAIEACQVDVLIQVNSRLTFGSEFLTTFLSGTRPYVVMLHDFQWYCPRVHLTDERRFYCGEPPPGVCQLCVSGGVGYNFADQTLLVEQNLDGWLAFNEAILRGATTLLAPSNDTAERYRRRFGLSNVVVAPHPERQPQGIRQVLARRRSSQRILRVAVVGAIGHHKGFELLVRLVERAARNRAPFFLSVIGFTPEDNRLLRNGNAEVTGSYRPSELQTRLDEADPDFVFLASVWPETYSYVLSEIWETGYPVVSFDIGAPADRIRSTNGGVLIPLTRDTHALFDSLMEAKDRLAALGPLDHVPAFIPSLEAYYDRWTTSSAAHPKTAAGEGDLAVGDLGEPSQEILPAHSGHATPGTIREQDLPDVVPDMRSDSGIVGHPSLGRGPTMEKTSP